MDRRTIDQIIDEFEQRASEALDAMTEELGLDEGEQGHISSVLTEITVLAKKYAED